MSQPPGEDAAAPPGPQVAAPAPQAALLSMIGGFRLTQAIYVAARLGLADLLASGPLAAPQLAELADAHPGALYRLLRALASAGIFAEDDDGCFRLTPLAQLLRRDVPGSLHGQAALMGEPWVWDVAGGMLASVRSGEPAFDRAYGMPFWDWLDGRPEQNAVFDAAMTSLSAQETDAILAACDFPDAGTVVDVGGGRGALLAAVLRAHPGIRGVLLDQAAVVAGAAELLAAAGVAGRCETVAGDMFTAVPPGGDVYLLKRVVHDWADRDVLAILRACHAAMPPGARLVLAEPVIAPGNEPHPAKFMDLQMLLSQHGRERTAAEFAGLLTAAGFTAGRVIPTASLLTLIEAEKTPAA